LLSNQDEVTNQIWNWIDTYISYPAEITNISIGIEHLNIFSTVILVNILKKLSIGITPSEKLVIRWYYEEDDEEILERGEYISSIIGFPVEFILINNISQL
jgi:hypothetical protein